MRKLRNISKSHVIPKILVLGIFSVTGYLLKHVSKIITKPKDVSLVFIKFIKDKGMKCNKNTNFNLVI